MDRFYRYIYQHYKGYILVKNNEHYGYYERLEDALYDRDRLEKVDWDIEKFIQLAETDNHYYAISLPPFEHKSRYIHHQKECWKIVREFDGKKVYFGSYPTLEEAIDRRDELVENGWVK